MKGDIIPNGEFLYKYVNPKVFPEGQTEIPYGIFEIKELSCDWEKYQQTPEGSFHVKEGKNLIIRISVCDEIKKPTNPKQLKQPQPAWEQKIEHDPVAKGDDLSHPEIDNFSHSLIIGLKKIPITKAIAENSAIYKIVSEEEYLQTQKVKIHASKKVLSPKDIIALLILLIIVFLVITAFLSFFNEQ